MHSGDVGERVEALLAQLRQQGGDPAAATGDELVRLLVEFYGAGLERIVEIVADDRRELLDVLADDPLIESQLILHGLHPVGVDERIERALDRVRPYLGSHAGGVAYLGIDDGGVAHLRLDGSCNGCPSSTVTVRMTIEEAVLGAAPEVAGIEVEGQTEKPKPLLQIGASRRRAATGSTHPGLAAPVGEGTAGRRSGRSGAPRRATRADVPSRRDVLRVCRQLCLVRRVARRRNSRRGRARLWLLRRTL